MPTVCYYFLSRNRDKANLLEGMSMRFVRTNYVCACIKTVNIFLYIIVHTHIVLTTLPCDRVTIGNLVSMQTE